MAVIETGGKQYKVSPGSMIKVEKLDVEVGKEVVLDNVLMVKKDEGTIFGDPMVKGARVVAEVVKQDRDKKIIVYKFKRRKGYHRKYGHRQDFTQLRIKEIIPQSSPSMGEGQGEGGQQTSSILPPP